MRNYHKWTMRERRMISETYHTKQHWYDDKWGRLAKLLGVERKTLITYRDHLVRTKVLSRKG